VVLLRDDAIKARLDEELGPALQRAAIDDLGVLRLELFDFVPQAHHLQPGSGLELTHSMLQFKT
jgi:hypothetical protein